MKEIMERLQALATDMTQKNEALSKSQSENNKTMKKLKEAVEVTKELGLSLQKREQAVRKIEDLVAYKNFADTLKTKAGELMRKAQDEWKTYLKNVEVRTSELAKEKSEVDTRQKNLDIKEERLNKKEEELIELKKNYKDKILEEVKAKLK